MPTIRADRNYIWGLAILADSLHFSVNNILAGLWLNCISSVEIALFLLADISLQYRALFHCKGLVKWLQIHYVNWSWVFLAATKQLYDWFSPSVCPSVTPFSPCSHYHIIMKFSGVITNDKSDVHAKGQGQRSKVKVTEVTTQLTGFRTVTPVWIHIYMMMKWCIELDDA